MNDMRTRIQRGDIQLERVEAIKVRSSQLQQIVVFISSIGNV